jgi:hypothetical protein
MKKNCDGLINFRYSSVTRSSDKKKLPPTYPSEKIAAKAEPKVEISKLLPKSQISSAAATITRKSSFNQFQKSVEGRANALSSTATNPPEKLPLDGRSVTYRRIQKRFHSIQKRRDITP